MTATRRAPPIIGRRGSIPPRATKSARSRTTRSPRWRRSSTRTAIFIAAASTSSASLPTDLRNVDDLTTKWPVLDKLEMAEDAAAHPPYGTYTAMSGRGVGRARLDDVRVIRHHRRAAGVSLFPCRPRAVGVGQCAGAACHGFPPRRYGVHGHRLWPARLGVGRAICARQDGAADLAGRRHGCAGPRQYRDPL